METPCFFCVQKIQFFGTESFVYTTRGDSKHLCLETESHHEFHGEIRETLSIYSMPQLDKVTFLSQFFWLCFFYLGFYYIILKFYLPKISRILALRRKKMGFSHEGMMSLQQENHLIRENYESLVSRALATSKNLFKTFFSRTTNWLNTNATVINKTHYQPVNTSYLQSLGESSLSQNLLFYHAGKNLPEKLTFKNLVQNLQNQKKFVSNQLPGMIKGQSDFQEAKKTKKK